MSPKSSSDHNSKYNANEDKVNTDLVREGIVLTHSIAISIINAYTEFVNNVPIMLEGWHNIFLDQPTRSQEERREKINLE
jgi:hypothetical protein